VNAERCLSLALAVVFCAIAFAVTRSAHLTFRITCYIAFCLVLVWYGNEIASYRSGRIDDTTPSIMVKIMGWILLLLAPLVIYTCTAGFQFRVR
jgi:hypothetical protein